MYYNNGSVEAAQSFWGRDQLTQLKKLIWTSYPRPIMDSIGVGTSLSASAIHGPIIDSIGVGTSLSASAIHGLLSFPWQECVIYAEEVINHGRAQAGPYIGEKIPLYEAPHAK